MTSSAGTLPLPEARQQAQGSDVWVEHGHRPWRAVWWLDRHSSGTGLGLRLRSKIFLASALVILVLGAVSALSLRAVGDLVSTNREIATRTVPAMSLTVSAREAIPQLVSLEARALILGDRRYATAWTGLATQVAEDFDRLAHYSLSEDEIRHRREASGAFDEYRRIVAEEHALVGRGEHTRARRLLDGSARLRAKQVQDSLDGLLAATRGRIAAAQAEAARLETRTWTAVLVALGAAVGLALLATAIVTRRVTRSLDVLSAAAADVAAGEFQQPIAVDSRDEIGVLARSFNAMATRLRQTEEAKQAFFATVAHELRSPLTSIGGAVHLLQSPTASLTERQQRLTDIITQSSDRLLGLANQILEMSRLRAGMADLDRNAFDLAALVGRVIEELHPQAEQAGISLEHERCGCDFAYLGDEKRLYQVVVNLGANAIRFTPRGGRVVVRLIDAGSEFELQVEDTGVGIPADALPNIFDPYRQAHRDRGGTGLGLAIVRGVAEAHGGRVTAESHEGKGTRFSVLLPRP